MKLKCVCVFTCLMRPSLLQQQDANGTKGDSPQLMGKRLRASRQLRMPVTFLTCIPTRSEPSSTKAPCKTAGSNSSAERACVTPTLLPSHRASAAQWTGLQFSSPAHQEARGSATRQLWEPINSHLTGIFSFTAQNRGA